MKRFLCAALCAALLFLLCACAPSGRTDRILVCVTEGSGVLVSGNGQYILPGESVSFLLTPEDGREILGVDYAGAYTLSQQGGDMLLTLGAVRVPTRVNVLTGEAAPDDPALRFFRTITYDPNGAPGSAFSVTIGIQDHPRPNTAISGFTREGFTFIGWNDAPDGSGMQVGPGSRVTVPQGGLTLYAQWARWTDETCFTIREEHDGACITGYSGEDLQLVIPERLRGLPVTAIAEGAFVQCPAETIVLPPTLLRAEPGAFSSCAVSTLVLFDAVRSLPDAAFDHCSELATLRICAATDPYGYHFRRESVFADKIDLLICAQGRKKLAFYGGCSMWYNLIGEEAAHRFGREYAVANLGLNGTVNSLVQMQIIAHFLEEGDILFHAPEISSAHQLLTFTDMYNGDDKLWSGIEYNYDLFSLVDIRGMHGVLDSLCHYLEQKKPGGTYDEVYRDVSGVSFMDYTGSIPFIRTQGRTSLSDTVSLDPDALSDGLPRLEAAYALMQAKGVRVYVSWACVDMDGLTEEEQGRVELMNERFSQIIAAMDGPVLISRLSDYLYTARDFYDTHYHLLTQHAYRNTEYWLRDLSAQLIADGLWQ